MQFSVIPKTPPIFSLREVLPACREYKQNIQSLVNRMFHTKARTYECQITNKCCVLSRDQAVNQGFSAQGCTCENKQKHSYGWTEMCGYYEMIYADAHMRYWQSKSWVSHCLRPEESHREHQRVTGHPAGAASYRAAHNRPLVDYTSPSREAEEELSGALKITQRG